MVPLLEDLELAEVLVLAPGFDVGECGDVGGVLAFLFRLADR